MVQQVRWGKIPAYCRDCKHVGHTSEVCYASGKIERPAKRDFHKATPKQRQYANQGAKGKQDQPTHKETHHDDSGMKTHLDRPTQSTTNNEWKHQGRHKDTGGSSSLITQGRESTGPEWEGPDIMGHAPEGRERDLGKQGLRGDPGEGPWPFMSSESAFTPYGRGFMSDSRRTSYARRGTFPSTRGGARGAGRFSSEGGRGDSSSTNYFKSNQYYTLMENGDFDVDGCGEVETSVMEVQPSPGEKAHTPLRIEGGGNHLDSECHGGTSPSPGTILPC